MTSFLVVTASSGPATDSDGYTVRIDADRREPLGTTDTLFVSGLVAGEHQVELQGVAPNCTVGDGGVRTVNTASDDSAVVRFDVLCSGTVGTLQLVTVSEGVDLDPSGFIARVDDVRELAVGPNAVVSTSLPAGTYQVTLVGIAGNCAVDGPNPRAVDLLSGGVTRLQFALHCSATTPAGPGHEIAFVRRGRDEGGLIIQQLLLMNDDGTSVRPLPTISDLVQRTPDWVSDGGRLGFLAVDERCDLVCARPYILTLSSGVAQPLDYVLVGFSDLHWSLDGSRIAFEQKSCFVDCEDEPVTTSIVVAEVEGSSEIQISSDSVDYFNPAWLPGGTGLLYVRVAEGLLDIARRSVDGFGETAISRNLAGELAGISDLAPSPDGLRLAFSAQPVGQGIEAPTQVYVMGMDGSVPAALTSGPSNNFDPAWAPDGRHIAMVSDRDGNDEIYVIESGGANPIRITNNAARDIDPAWRP